MGDAPEKPKPARRQVDAAVTGREERMDPTQYNLWTGHKLREFRSDKRAPKEVSKYRCRPALDEGWTRGEGMDCAYCCLYFARGLCHHGSDCNYLHRVPTEAHERRLRADYGHDIFGRDRNPSSRDNRKGVGSYERECRTLYIHYGGAGALPVLELRRLIEKNFKEWGLIEDIHVVPNKTIAFVRYYWRSSAEFAKAAMHQQGLDGSKMGEVLDVRFANDDPNPRAVERVKREREESFRDAYVQAVNELPPEQKQARLHQLNLLANVRPGGTTSAYPDTNAQYGAGGYRHEYQGWDQYQYAQGDPEQQHQRYMQHFHPDVAAAQLHGAGAAAAAGWGGAGGEGGDDIARYLPPEAWAAEAAVAEEEEEEVPPELLEFTPDLIGADAPPLQQQQQHQQQGQPQAAAGSAGAEGALQPTAAANGAGAAAAQKEEEENALGLLGGYGSSSEEDEGG